MIILQIRTRVSKFRSEVKEECVKIAEKFLEDVAGMPERISQIVEGQLENYNYVFPSSSKVCVVFLLNLVREYDKSVDSFEAIPE